MTAEVTSIAGGPYDSNIYLLRREKDAVLVDAGTGLWSDSVASRVARELEGADFHGVLLTHEHFDHCGGAASIVAGLGGSVFASAEAARVIGGPDTTFTGSFLFGARMDPVKNVRVLGDEVSLGCLTLRVVPSPGHCRGLVCFHEPDGGSLFCGDLIFCDGGVGRWDLPGGDLRAHLRSVRSLLDMEFNALYPGHGRNEVDDPGAEVRKAWDSLSSVSSWS